jgi:hypothetical protein
MNFGLWIMDFEIFPSKGGVPAGRGGLQTHNNHPLPPPKEGNESRRESGMIKKNYKLWILDFEQFKIHNLKLIKSLKLKIKK